MKTKPCTIALAVFLVIFSLIPQTRATELLPGQTISVATLSVSAVAFDALSPARPAYLVYQEPNVGTRASYTYYESLYSTFVVDAAGNEQVIYGFGQPEFGLHPPSPNDPLASINDLPPDTVISISGFGTGPVEMSAFPTLDALAGFPARSIQRSASGDVLTLTNFTPTNPFNAPQPSLGLSIVVPGKSFALSTATISLTDLEGNPRILTTDVLAPIPEPTSLALLPLALVALTLRLRPRTN